MLQQENNPMELVFITIEALVIFLAKGFLLTVLIVWSMFMSWLDMLHAAKLLAQSDRDNAKHFGVYR